MDSCQGAGANFSRAARLAAGRIGASGFMARGSGSRQNGEMPGKNRGHCERIENRALWAHDGPQFPAAQSRIVLPGRKDLLAGRAISSPSPRCPSPSPHRPPARAIPPISSQAGSPRTFRANTLAVLADQDHLRDRENAVVRRHRLVGAAGLVAVQQDRPGIFLLLHEILNRLAIAIDADAHHVETRACDRPRNTSRCSEFLRGRDRTRWQRNR